MNFLLRTAQTVAPDQSAAQRHVEARVVPKAATTLEGLIAEDPFPLPEDGEKDGDAVGGGSFSHLGSTMNNQVPTVENHVDVTDDEGWINIPCKDLPDNWNDAADIHSFTNSDRSFVFPGEQISILACLSASNKDKEIITPFRVAALMSKHQNGNAESKPDSATEGEKETEMKHSNISQNPEENGVTELTTKIPVPETDISASESILRMEDYKKQSEAQLTRFKNSHFFVRIAESDELLWSKRSAPESSYRTSNLKRENITTNEPGAGKLSGTCDNLNAFIDRGKFDASVSGGVARDTVRCCSLPNGDIVVLLQVNVGVSSLTDPVLEVLQFEKYQDCNLAYTKADNLVNANPEDPCADLLNWLLPLNRALPPPARPLSPPSFSSSTSIGSSAHKSSFSATSGSQLFSHLRSYSMSSLPQNSNPAPVVPTSIAKPTFDIDDWDHISPKKPLKRQEVGNLGLLSFRGVPLEPQRFSVRCGLEGIYTPGRRWRRKIEIVHPVEIHSFAADCNAEDLLCVQIKNVSPSHTPDLVVYLDAITVVYEEAPKTGPSLSLPIACIEAGNNHSFPNLALRRGEEHSFILKPATSMWRNPKAHSERSRQLSQSLSGSSTSNLYLPLKTGEAKRMSSSADQYAVLVSYRCNFSESQLFLKQRTSWRPRVTRDLMISVASEMSEQTSGPKEGASKLPVQVLTLQASNLTSEDLTLTVRAPASFTSPPSVVSLNSPSTPVNPFVGFSELAGRVSGERSVQRLKSAPSVSSSNHKEKPGGAGSVSFDKHTVSISDVVPSTGLGCTHLWLQSAVPLGCVPSQSMATVKLELLPLTDGIITLDTLQIHVKEKGETYIPEHSLKINATSSIARGVSVS